MKALFVEFMWRAIQRELNEWTEVLLTKNASHINDQYLDE